MNSVLEHYDWNTPLYAFDFRLIENLVTFRVYSSIFTHISKYIHAYSSIIQAHSGILFKNIEEYPTYVNVAYSEL